MGDSRQRYFNNLLARLSSRSPDVEGSAIVSRDGLIMASHFPGGFDVDRMSAMSAAMLSLGDSICQELVRGGLEQIYIRGTSGYVILSAAGEDSVLAVLVRKRAKLGLVLSEMGRMIVYLERLL